MDYMRGIRVPGGFECALSIRTTYRAPGQDRPYEDEIGADGVIRYSWFKEDPHHRDNAGLRRAWELGAPVIWFVGVGMNPARYQIVAPVYVIDEEPEMKRFVMVPADIDAMDALSAPRGTIEDRMKNYQQQVTMRRVHQPLFRSEVLVAYEDRCAVCNLGHRRLLDAAHIMPDSHDAGIASVVNGVAMCKIHHAAFDSYFLGIRPDLIVEIRSDLLGEVDGPMLRHGLQELHGKRLMKIPSAKSARPGRELLEMKYEMFRSATPADVV